MIMPAIRALLLVRDLMGSGQKSIVHKCALKGYKVWSAVDDISDCSTFVLQFSFIAKYTL